MARSERRRNDISRSRKATGVGVFIGALVAWRVYSIASPTRVEEWFQKVVELAIASVLLVAQLCGVTAWLEAGAELLAGFDLTKTFGLPIAAGLVFAYTIRKLLLIDKPFGRPIIDWIWPCLPDILDPRLEREGLPRYSAFATEASFLERDVEMRLLRRFAGDADSPSVRFMYVKGKEGVGKTRLGLEWLKSMRAFGWDVGILDPGTKPLDVRRSRFRRETAILIDEPGSLPEFWQILDELLRHATKIRIVLTSQVSPHPPASLDTDMRRRIEGAEAQSLRLGGLDDKSLTKLAPDAGAERVADSGGCPLLVLLKPDDLEEVLRRVGIREETAKARSLYRVLAFAALAGPVSRIDLDDKMGQGIATSALEPLFEDADRSTLGAVLPAFRPDVFADQIVLNYTLDHPGDRRPLFEKAIGLNPGACEHRLASLWRRQGLNADRSHMRKALQELFDEIVPERRQSLLDRAAVLVDLTAPNPPKDAKGTADFDSLADALDELADIVEMRPFDQDIRLREAMGAANAILYYGKVGDFAEMERWGARLIALAEDTAFIRNREIRLWEAIGAANATMRYAGADLERWGARLIALAENPAFIGDWEIRLMEARGASNAILRCGQAGDFAGLERWGARLIALAENPAFSKNREIRLMEAMGAANATMHGVADLERWGARLIALAEDPAFIGDWEIRLYEAQGASNAILRYGEMGDFAGLERWGARLTALAENPAFIKNREIRLMEAIGAVNATKCYGGKGYFTGLERWGARLIALAEDPAFIGDWEIRLEEARGAFNAMSSYREKDAFAGLERWGARLIAIAENPAFIRNREIRLAEVKGAFKATYYYGEVGDFAGLERWGARLIAVAENPAFSGDWEIRLHEAMGAVNVINDYGRAGAAFALNRELWWRRLANVARNFPGHSKIQDLANRFNLTYSAQAAKGWPYGAPACIGLAGDRS